MHQEVSTFSGVNLDADLSDFGVFMSRLKLKPQHLARMGGANGSRECAPDDKLRDTHQLHFMEMMGFAGSTQYA